MIDPCWPLPGNWVATCCNVGYGNCQQLVCAMVSLDVVVWYDGVPFWTYLYAADLWGWCCRHQPQPQKRPYWQSCTVMLVARLQSTKLGCPFHDNMILDSPHISLHSWTKGWGSWCVCNSWISFILLDISSSLQHELLCTSMVADIHFFSVTFHWLLSVTA